MSRAQSGLFGYCPHRITVYIRGDIIRAMYVHILHIIQLLLAVSSRVMFRL